MSIVDNRIIKITHEIKGARQQYVFYCPACKEVHIIDDSWGFNQDYVKPTITPSILVTKPNLPDRCHSFVTDGKIKYLGDCSHALKNTTVELGPFKWD